MMQSEQERQHYAESRGLNRDLTAALASANATIATLTANLAAANERAEKAEAYKTAVDNELIVRELGVAKDNPRDEIGQLINWEVEVSHDPKVSERAREEQAQLTTLTAALAAANERAEENHRGYLHACEVASGHLAEVARLQARSTIAQRELAEIRGKLPVTEDGAAAVPGMEVWLSPLPSQDSPERARVIAVYDHDRHISIATEGSSEQRTVPLCLVFSTREAAESASGKEGEDA